jgi:CRISPR-associated protein Csh2
MTMLNRSEILFLYDVTDANPNGDPVDENKPRIDEETGINMVTDVRLKRTVRDYLHSPKQKSVFVLETRDGEGRLRTKEDRLNDFNNDFETLITKCIDIRLFGATIAVKEKTLTLTGPVQFKMGRSLHRVDLTFIKGTTVMPSKEGLKQGTFTEKYILPYSLIAFYGVVNENAAKDQNIPLSEEDLTLLLEALWNGTKNLLSGSKAGQMPRFLLQVEHKPGYSHFGELDKRIKFVSDKDDLALRGIRDGSLEIKDLQELFRKNQDEILKMRVKADDALTLTSDGKPVSVSEAFSGLPYEEITF